MGAETWENRFRINRGRYRKINHLEGRISAQMRKRFPPKLLIRLGFLSRLENRRGETHREFESHRTRQIMETAPVMGRFFLSHAFAKAGLS